MKKKKTREEVAGNQEEGKGQGFFDDGGKGQRMPLCVGKKEGLSEMMNGRLGENRGKPFKKLRGGK